DALAWESTLTRHTEQERRSRVFQVDAVPQSRQPLLPLDVIRHDALSRLRDLDGFAMRHIQSSFDHFHAGQSCAGVHVANGQYSWGDGRLGRLSVRAGHEP